MDKTIKLACVDSKFSHIIEMEYDELILCDGYYVHRAKGKRERMSEKMGDGIWEEVDFDYEHYSLKRFIVGVDWGWYNEDEMYCVLIEMSGVDRESISWFDNSEGAKELADTIWDWLKEK